MLAAIDRVLAPLTWVAAAFVVLVLFVGPELIGADKPAAAPPASAAPASGESVFADNCASCHTLEAAGSSGTLGPNLDSLAPTTGTVESTVRSGEGTMPSFEGRLSDPEIAAVAEYVSSSAGGG
jgi:cytochrome c6